MYRVALIWVVSAVLAFTGCSGSHSADREQLRSDAKELVSIASESELFAKFVVEGHATDAYAKGHPDYLRKQATEAEQELGKKDSEPRLAHELTELRSAAAQLNSALATLPTDAHDPRWKELEHQFASISRSADEVERRL